MIDNFSKLGWTVSFEIKNSQTIKGSFEIFLTISKRKSKLIETDRDKEFYKNIFQNILNKNNNKNCSRKTSLGAAFAERFNCTIRDLLKRPVSEKGDGY